MRQAMYLRSALRLIDDLVAAFARPLRRRAQHRRDALWQRPPTMTSRAGTGDGAVIDLVIVDPSLDGFVGHHYDYDISTADAARRAGSRVSILGKTPASASLRAQADFMPIFRLAMWDKSPDATNFSEDDLLFCNRCFYEDLLTGLAGIRLAPGSVIFGHMITAKQLLAWAWFLKSHSVPLGLELVLLLRYEASVYGGRFADWAFRCFEAQATAGRLRLASDSSLLIRDYGSLTTAPFELMPIPHTRPVRPQPHEIAVNSSRPMRCVCLGNPRVDKGFLDVLDAIELFASEGAGNLHFLLQTNDPGEGIEPRLSRFLREPHANVTLLPEALSSERYGAALASADVILLPYWSSVYGARTSGVFVEAVAAGRVVICSEGTWMAEELREHGAGLLCRERDPVSLAEAIRAVLRNHEQLSTRAKRLAPAYAAMHTADALAATLISGRSSQRPAQL